MYSLAGTDLDANDIFSNYPEDKASDFTPFGDYTPAGGGHSSTFSPQPEQLWSP